MQFVQRAARPKVQSGLRPVASITVAVHAITQNSRMKKHTAALMGHPALVVTNVLFPSQGTIQTIELQYEIAKKS